MTASLLNALTGRRLVARALASAAAIVPATHATHARAQPRGAAPVFEPLEGRRLLAADLTAGYDWNPVRIGAGGLVTGLVTSPTDAAVRYARTDVGNAYRWDAAKAEWLPMVVRRADGTGVSAEVAAHPAITGIESIALDPSNPANVYFSMPLDRPNLPGVADVPGTVFKSTDGGRNFAKTGLTVNMKPNSSSFRASGERMAVDPNDSSRLFYGSYDNGLWRSTDGGANWQRLTGTNAPTATDQVLNVVIHDAGATSVVYAVALQDASNEEWVYPTGRVLRSTDGGASWQNITPAGLTTPSETALAPDGTLFVTQRYGKAVWRYKAGVWISPSANTTNDPEGVAVDPTRPSRVFALSSNGGLSRSLDGGATYTNIASRTNFANALGWLPQPIQPEYHGTTGIRFGADGTLYMTQGNEGVASWKPSATDAESLGNPPQWKIVSQGIEELVTHDVTLLPGKGGRAITAVHDATGFVIDDPSTFTAEWIDQQTQLIVNATGVSYAPDDPNFVVLQSGDPNNTSSGANFSSYSTDAGQTWKYYASRPKNLQGGYPAVGRREGRGEGQDHIVVLPQGSKVPYYSLDGGQSWQASNPFVDPAGKAVDPTGFWVLSLKQHPLRADPFVADRFYLKFVVGGLWRSDNAGRDWVQIDDADLPTFAHHGQLEANRAVQNDLWFASGWEGTVNFRDNTEAGNHGVWHSTDGGDKWAKLPNVDYASAITLGKGRGQAGDAPYSVYVFGRVDGDANYGTFRTNDAGASWERISFYPTGIFDQVTSLGASWDTYGLVYAGFTGNSFVYGKPKATTPPPTTPPAAGAVVPIEAESGRVGALFDTPSDAGAGGGKYLVVKPGNNAYTAAPADAAGRASYDFTLGSAGTYKVWGRTITSASGGDSFWVRVDGGAWAQWNGIPRSTDWAWDDVHESRNNKAAVTFNLAAGAHTIDVAYREDGTRLDRLVVQPAAAAAPTGVGPAVPTPPAPPVAQAVKIEAESAASVAGPWTTATEGGVTFRRVANGASGVASYRDAAALSGAPTLTYTFAAVAQNYALKFRGRGESGDNSFWARVNGGAWQRVNLPAGAGWTTVDVGTFAVTAGSGNTLQVAQREDGTLFDHAEFVPV